MSKAKKDEFYLHRPIDLVYDARENAYLWHEVCLDTFQGFKDISEQEAQVRFHNAVMQYWAVLKVELMKRDAMSHFWEKEELFETSDGAVKGLKSLSQYRFSTQSVVEQNPTLCSGGRQTEREVAVHLTPAQCASVLDVLDRALAELDLSVPLGTPEGVTEPI